MWEGIIQVAIGASIVAGFVGQHGWLVVTSIAGLLVIALVLGSSRASRGASGAAPPSMPSPTQKATMPRLDRREQAAFRRLLVMARGDRALVERLIQYEARRSHSASRAANIEDAIWRWDRDNR